MTNNTPNNTLCTAASTTKTVNDPLKYKVPAQQNLPGQ